VPRSWKSRAIRLPTLWATPDLQRDHFNLIFFIYIYYYFNKYINKFIIIVNDHKLVRTH